MSPGRQPPTWETSTPGSPTTIPRRLADHPGLGHIRDDLADETLKVWPVHSYLVIYRPATTPLQVVRVLSGYRDIAALFE